MSNEYFAAAVTAILSLHAHAFMSKVGNLATRVHSQEICFLQEKSSWGKSDFLFT